MKWGLMQSAPIFYEKDGAVLVRDPPNEELQTLDAWLDNWSEFDRVRFASRWRYYKYYYGKNTDNLPEAEPMAEERGLLARLLDKVRGGNE